MNKAQAIKLLEAALDHIRAGDESIIEPLIEPLTSLDIALGEDPTSIDAVAGQPELYALLINSMPDGVVMRSPTGEYLPDMINPAARQLLPSFAILDRFQVPIEEGLNIDVGERTLSITMAHMTLENHGGYIGDVFILRDVTTEVATTHTYHSLLFNTITYELRTPLASVRGYAELTLLALKEEKFTFEQQIEFLNKIIQYADQILGIIDDALDYNHLVQESESLRQKLILQKGKLKASYPSRVDLVKLMQQAIDKHQPDFGKAGLTPQFEHDESAIHIWADEDSLQLALHALLENAYHFSPDGGSLKVDLHIKDTRVVLRITDPGVGISEEAKAKIFDAFYRSYPKDSQGNYIEWRGVGIGLYIAKMVAELHNGSLELTHTEVGKGSTFTLYLPLPT